MFKIKKEDFRIVFILLNFLFKIREGNTRIAFILFNFLVIKVPNPRLDWYILDYETRKNFIGFLKKIPRNIYGAMLYGITANISEALIFYAKGGRKKTNFLTPVFTLGICSFQIYQGEEKSIADELLLFFENLSDESKKCSKRLASTNLILVIGV